MLKLRWKANYDIKHMETGKTYDVVILVKNSNYWVKVPDVNYNFIYESEERMHEDWEELKH